MKSAMDKDGKKDEFGVPTVFVVDDDASVRKGVSRLIRSAGFNVEAFSSAEDFLKRQTPDQGGCIVLDIQMPGLNGMDLQETLSKAEHSMPIIFITGHGDILKSVCAMKKGAVDFLTKPFDGQILIDAIRVALRKDKKTRARNAETAEIRNREKTLTPREHEVMKFVITGMLNKQIANELGISEKTVKVHRGRVMTKIGVTSVAELVRLCEKAEGNSRLRHTERVTTASQGDGYPWARNIMFRVCWNNQAPQAQYHRETFARVKP